MVNDLNNLKRKFGILKGQTIEVINAVANVFIDIKPPKNKKIRGVVFDLI